jgi:hypothetical protein
VDAVEIELAAGTARLTARLGDPEVVVIAVAEGTCRLVDKAMLGAVVAKMMVAAAGQARFTVSEGVCPAAEIDVADGTARF